MTKKLVLLLSFALFLVQCKEFGNKGIIPENTTEHKTLSKEVYKAIAEQTKKNLVENLTKQISENGAINALQFCNVNAIPLTQKLETEKGVTIKRVSDKNRNPENLANEAELEIIKRFKAQLAKKEELKGTLKWSFLCTYYNQCYVFAMSRHGKKYKTRSYGEDKIFISSR